LEQAGDPTTLINQLDDRYPVLLFPLRLESRFKKINRDGVTENELWVRIYPDDCQVESFTEFISEGELKNIQSFWMAYWAAGKIEDQQRAAWRSLVIAVGSGRAAWLYQQYKPLQLAGPEKTDKNDLILVIKKDPTVHGVEENAAKNYWKEIWMADGNHNKINQAFTNLKNTTNQQRAVYISEENQPFNIGDPSPTGINREDIRISVEFIAFPADDSISIAASSWTQAPKVKSLPEKFVITGYNKGEEPLVFITRDVDDELHVGPDPSLPDSEQIKHTQGDLQVNKELVWLTDFDQAVASGMGGRIPITQAQAEGGFEKLLVTGIRFSTDEYRSAELVNDLFSNHYHSSNGFSILPQGTPTNNTEEQNAGYNSVDNADISYDIVFKEKEAFIGSDDPMEKADGQWLAEGLGISPSFLKKVPNASGWDQAETRAMSTALWPATMGYFLEEMMPPAVKIKQINLTRDFFTRFVSGRGALPAIRIGRQPYGILPSTAFSRMQFHRDQSLFTTNFHGLGDTSQYLDGLHSFLLKVDGQWNELVKQVAYAGKGGNPHQQLLDIIGLHPSSVEYYQRYAESFQQLFNEMVHRYGQAWGAVFANFHQQAKTNILNEANITSSELIPMLDKYFLGKPNLLSGDIIDDQPLSEIKNIREYTADKKNYISWLIESGVDRIRKQDFGGNTPPDSLLYLWLRHSMLLSFWDGSLRLYESAGITDVHLNKREPEFIHVQDTDHSESKW
ncbi:MAG: hypothetical protein H0U44_07900, partial [Flavisolibacter sp.]|nr:hypothetical protein [Flavisolibacter sp.]